MLKKFRDVYHVVGGHGVAKEESKAESGPKVMKEQNALTLVKPRRSK
jgi:hypothetical protein